ncbi:sigma-70 family RNA polymerase sigma factor [Radiobacillus kanasensis]|uniref:RNA polymerase sigma factor n=1 Tax=Radiobacillus kanasensis TaxID=2844358 RepID=UPI001E46CA21|nr:sigma-70 family RNA polymerase sigma factor [Radiobacillus kanasensis]UFT99554.1 sigma-70 family RNA polymerase sigma factor [Radiobacillus kanasensis]
MKGYNKLADQIGDIYEEHHSTVYKFLICLVNNSHEAEDLTQEVFIRVLKSSASFNYQSKLSTWILSIARHVAIDHLRKRKFTSIFSQTFFDQVPETKGLPEQEIDLWERRATVRKAINSLKPKYKMVVILRGINNLTIKETAEVLNCKESKVKVLYHRALKQLKTKLDPSLGEVAIENVNR